MEKLKMALICVMFFLLISNFDEKCVNDREEDVPSIWSIENEI